MEVNLLYSTPLYIAIMAIRRCYDSMDKSDSNIFDLGEKDQDLLRKIIKDGHTSTLEHIVFTFEINGISRACLQELARHRMASLSVQSTRYTLNKFLKNGTPAKDLLVLTGDVSVDSLNQAFLETLLRHYDSFPNDFLKYLLPEAYKTSLIWSINARSLRNFLQLRSSTRALWEMQKLAGKVKKAIGEEYQILFEDIELHYEKEESYN